MTGVTPEQAKEQALARFSDQGPGHINCAQAVVCYALLLLGKNPESIILARYFGGGIAGMGETCGAVTGTGLALGLRDCGLASAPAELAHCTRTQLQELIRDFTLEHGALRCADLTGCDLTTPEGHDVFVASGANQRCAGYVGWMCDQLTPMLLDPET